MASEEIQKRWAGDWSTVKQVVGKKAESIQFSEKDGRERLLIRFMDGTRLIAEAQDDGTMRAWLNCCGKPDGCAPEVKS